MLLLENMVTVIKIKPSSIFISFCLVSRNQGLKKWQNSVAFLTKNNVFPHKLIFLRDFILWTSISMLDFSEEHTCKNEMKKSSL